MGGLVPGGGRAERTELLHPLEEFTLAMRRADACERILDAALRSPAGIPLLVEFCAREKVGAREPGSVEEVAGNEGSEGGGAGRPWFARRLACLGDNVSEPEGFLAPTTPLTALRRAALHLGRRMSLSIDETYLLAARTRDVCVHARDGGHPEAAAAMRLAEVTLAASRELDAVRNELVQRNLRLVWPLAREGLNRGLDLEDLVQAGSTGLIRAAEKFDWSRGTRFSTYATHWVRVSVQRAIENEGATIRLPAHLCALAAKVRRALWHLQGDETPDASILAESLKEPVKRVQAVLMYLRPTLSLEQPLGEDGEAALGAQLHSEEESALEHVTRSQEARLVSDAIGSLPERTAFILRMRFGMLGRREHTLEEIAGELNVTRERVRQIESEALDLLVKRLRVRGLDELVARESPPKRLRRNARAAKTV